MNILFISDIVGDPGRRAVKQHLAALQHQLVEKIRSEIQVKPKVDLVAPGSLPVAEGKARRVIDKRSL